MAETLRIQDKPVAVEGPADQYTLRNLGPDTAYYGAANVSSSSNDGSIAAGSSVTVAPTKWLVSAGQSRVTVAAVAQGSSGSGGGIDIRSKGASTAAADNTTAIQAALDDAVAQGVPVYVPPGTWKTGSLKVQSGALIQGDGWASILQFIDNAGAGLALNARRGLFEPKNFATTTVTGVTIRDLKMLGNAAGQWGGGPPTGGAPAPMLHGVWGVGITHWLFERLWTEDFDGDGIYLGRSAAGQSPSAAHHNRVVECVAMGNYRNGMMLSDGDYNVFRDCLLQGNQRGMDPASPKYQGTDATASPYPSGEFDLEPNGAGQRCWYTRFLNVTFADGWWVGMQMGGNAGNVSRSLVEGCVFRDNKFRGLHSTKPTNNYNTFRGNVFEATAPANVSSCHLRIFQGSDNLVEGNHFIGATGSTDSVAAIQFDSAGGTRPQRNRFVRNVIDIGTGAVLVDATCDGTEIDGNTVLSGSLDLRDTTRIRRGEHVQRRGLWVPGGSLPVAKADYTLVANRGVFQRFVPDQDLPLAQVEFAVKTAASLNDQIDIAIFAAVPSAGSGLTANYTQLARSGGVSNKMQTVGVKSVPLAYNLRRGVTYFLAFAAQVGGTAAVLEGMQWPSAAVAQWLSATGPEVENLYKDSGVFSVLNNATVGSYTAVGTDFPLFFLRSTN